MQDKKIFLYKGGAKRGRGKPLDIYSTSGYDDEASINGDEEDVRARTDRSGRAEKEQEAHEARDRLLVSVGPSATRGRVTSSSPPGHLFLILRIQLVL